MDLRLTGVEMRDVMLDIILYLSAVKGSNGASYIKSLYSICVSS